MPSVTWLVHVPAGMLRLWLDRLVPETVRMHQGSETAVAAALERLRPEDERVAGDAEAALGSLTWDQGLQAITQHGLQTFLWYELPRKWLTDLEGKLHIAASLGRLLELVGLRRYAAICRGPETTAMLQAYERSSREGFRSFRRAQARSGVEPPDLPGPPLWFARGPAMGEQEAGAFFGTVASGPQVPPAGSKVEPLPVQTAVRSAQSDQSWASPMALRSSGGGRRCQ